MWRFVASPEPTVVKVKNTFKLGGLSDVALSWDSRELNPIPGSQRMRLMLVF